MKFERPRYLHAVTIAGFLAATVALCPRTASAEPVTCVVEVSVEELVTNVWQMKLEPGTAIGAFGQEGQLPSCRDFTASRPPLFFNRITSEGAVPVRAGLVRDPPWSSPLFECAIGVAGSA